MKKQTEDRDEGLFDSSPPLKFVPPLASGCTCGRGDLDVDPNCPLHFPKAAAPK